MPRWPIMMIGVQQKASATSPWLWTPFGGWQGAALDVLAKFGRQLERQLGKEEEEDEVTRQLRQRPSVLLTRDNVAMQSESSNFATSHTVDGDIEGGEDLCNPISTIMSMLPSTFQNIYYFYYYF